MSILLPTFLNRTIIWNRYYHPIQLDPLFGDR